MHRLVIIRPVADGVGIGEICDDYGIGYPPGPFPTLGRIPLIVAIFDPDEKIHWTSTMYLFDVAKSSRSVTGDTVLSYARSLLVWLDYLAECGVEPAEATEHDLQLFRNLVWSPSSPSNSGRPGASRSTVIARVETARRFHEWGEQSQRFTSPLGVWAQAQTNYAKSMRQGPYLPRRSSLSLPSEQRIPKILNAGDLKKIVQFAPLPYSLIFKWAVTTGLRRMELCKLTTLEFDAISFHGDRNNVMSFDTIRKGGRRVTAYLPAKLFHDTRWYINMSRGLPQSGEERFVFLTPSGCRPHREQVSRVFRQCADQIGSRAIFHHLRHTFAVTALEILQRQANAGSSINPLKTLQLMMGHASIASTEIYLTALDIYSDDVAEALDFLYGASA